MAEATPEALEQLEEDLTHEVPTLLEAMNRASSEVNTLQRHLGEAQERYRHLLEQWGCLYEELQARYGPDLDTVRPFFEAQQTVSAASHRAQGIVREFSAVASQHGRTKTELRHLEECLAQPGDHVSLSIEQQEGLCRATLQVLRSQEARDKCEAEYARILHECQDAQEAAERWRVELGEPLIRRMMPCFRQLYQHQAELSAEQGRISSLAERTRAAKNVYHKSLRELDRINVAVHSVRQHKDASPGGGSTATCSAAVTGRASSALPIAALGAHRRGPMLPPEVSPEREPAGSCDSTPHSSKSFFGSEDSEIFAFGTPEEAFCSLPSSDATQGRTDAAAVGPKPGASAEDPHDEAIDEGPFA